MHAFLESSKWFIAILNRMIANSESRDLIFNDNLCHGIALFLSDRRQRTSGTCLETVVISAG
ncbi:hypothetical protein VFPPC_17553 [Pochonia chlamydosporia 170]|uniref:Uncharacterized protein n=1 Tax=Pochonia chlamydosporia 170 TaxID=1380566 RepID=A0A219ASL7_METCM|nr:hypothetical protein VFPPC_17553 [Pochonia chlamydosporia 170]OWT43284.1 hypothetical protein VFPPC_17553 [Pochonia chlamydosporia 170]